MTGPSERRGEAQESTGGESLLTVMIALIANTLIAIAKSVVAVRELLQQSAAPAREGVDVVDAKVGAQQQDSGEREQWGDQRALEGPVDPEQAEAESTTVTEDPEDRDRDAFVGEPVAGDVDQHPGGQDQGQEPDLMGAGGDQDPGCDRGHEQVGGRSDAADAGQGEPAQGQADGHRQDRSGGDRVERGQERGAGEGERRQDDVVGSLTVALGDRADEGAQSARDRAPHAGGGGSGGVQVGQQAGATQGEHPCGLGGWAGDGRDRQGGDPRAGGRQAAQ